MSKDIRKKKRKNNNFSTLSEVQTLSYPVFCFKHLTTNKTYNFDYFKNPKDINEAKSIILDKLIETQSKTWLQLHQLDKRAGIETLSYGDIRVSANNYEILKDQNVYVFRLNSQKWRIIGIKSEINKDVLHIIGFDFNYSAYNH